MKYLIIFFLLFTTPCWGGIDHSTDAADDIMVTDHADLRPASSLSVMAWFNTSSNPASNMMILTKHRDSANGYTSYAISLDQSGGWDVECVANDGDWDIISSNSNGYNDGNWHSAVCQWDSGTLRMYIDGAVQTQTDSSASLDYTNNEDLRIGNWNFTGGSGEQDPYIGKMSELSIWSAVLTAAEISQLHNAEVKRMPLQIQPSSLELYLPLDDHPDGTDIDGDTFRDLSGNGHDGTGTDVDNDSYNAAEEVLSYP